MRQEFKYPVDCVGVDSSDPPLGLTLSELKVGDLIAIERRVGLKPQAHVARVLRTFIGNGYANVELYSVPSTERFGPWVRRKWSVLTDELGSKQEVVPESEILCTVNLVEGALDSPSLEKLALLGVPISGVPRLDSAMPGRLE